MIRCKIFGHSFMKDQSGCDFATLYCKKCGLYIISDLVKLK